MLIINKDTTWIGIAIVAVMIIGDLLNREAFKTIILIVTAIIVLGLIVFHILDKLGKLS